MRLIPPDEPLFLFRGTDPHLPHVLTCYLHMCLTGGCEQPMLDGLKDQINTIREFQSANPGRVKKPT